jgi:hypothetical protein
MTGVTFAVVFLGMILASIAAARFERPRRRLDAARRRRHGNWEMPPSRALDDLPATPSLAALRAAREKVRAAFTGSQPAVVQPAASAPRPAFSAWRFPPADSSPMWDRELDGR